MNKLFQKPRHSFKFIFLIFSLFLSQVYANEITEKQDSPKNNRKKTSVFQKAKNGILSPFRFIKKQSKTFYKEQTDPNFQKTSRSGRLMRVFGAIGTLAIVGGAPAMLLGGAVAKGIKGNGGSDAPETPNVSEPTVRKDIVLPNLASNPAQSHVWKSISSSPIITSQRQSNKCITELTGSSLGRSPNIISSTGKNLGNLNTNQFDPDSVSNPYGKYGSPYSSKSINNPYGRYGSPYSPESVNNPFGS